MLLALAATVVSLAPPALPLRPCVVQAVDARCGTYAVAENRAKPDARTIDVNLVVIPARRKPARADAFTFLAGGPGGAAATEMPATALAIWPRVHEHHDILLVDQRGTGGSNELSCTPPKRPIATEAAGRAFLAHCLATANGDPRFYGTPDAMDDLDAVRAALGYASLDVYGTSYGATAAQVFLLRHPRSVRTMFLDGATFLDVPFYSRFAANAARALDLLARRCTADVACRTHFPAWTQQLRALVVRWNRKPVRLRAKGYLTGDGLASVVQQMLLDGSRAARIPFVVARAAAGRYAPLAGEVDVGGAIYSLMYWSIWCNEPWVGLGATGPWRTLFDGTARASLREHRTVCRFIPKRAERAADWMRPHSHVPLLAIEGEADPQDPIGNLPGLRTAFPNSRVVTAPAQGHAVGHLGCIGELVGRVVDRGTVDGLDTSCLRRIVPTAFQLVP